MNMERRDNVKQSALQPNCVTQEEAVLDQTKAFQINKWQVARAYQLVKANDGSAGVDNQSLQDFDQNLKGNLYKIWNRLSSGSYMPPPVKGVAIPKKSGGERLLGIPTVSDRIAQMTVLLSFEPLVEPHFLNDSYGYRPGKSALDAIAITRKRCWRYDWCLEFDIKGLFDNIPHDLLLKAVEKHCSDEWVILYIKRWLTAPMQLPDGQLQQRTKGTPQGGIVSPVLSNLFLHYVFDKWLAKYYSHVPWCRYADDGLVHCRSKKQAEEMYAALKHRFESCGLELHPTKTKIVYCKDAGRLGNHEITSFDFLGYTFRARTVQGKGRDNVFMSFTPAVSKDALKAMRYKIRKLRIRCRTDMSIHEISKWLSPMVQGWINYYGKFHRSSMKIIGRHLNMTLVRWARRKYKSIRRHKIKACQFMERMAAQAPYLFPNWRAKLGTAFA